MAASLTMVKLPKSPAQVFSHESAEEDDKVLEFIRKMHAPLYAIMAREMNRFDILVGLSTRKEAIDRFLQLSTD